LNLLGQKTGYCDPRDSRRRRRLFRLVKKIQRITSVVLVWMVGVAILYGIYTVAFLKPYFEVSDINVRGDLHYLTKEEIITSSGIQAGDHLLRLPVKEIQKRLSEHPWIKEVAVHRKLPRMVWIYVKEYEPVAIVRTDDWYYVNRFGVPFKKLDSSDDHNFPVITGLETFAESGFEGTFRSHLVEMLRVLNLYEALPVGESYGVSEIHFNPNRGASVITLNDPMELRLGFGPFVEKMNRLQTVYPAMRSHGGVIAYVDLSSEGKVVVKYGT